MRLEFARIILRDFKEYRGKHALDLAGLGFGLHYVRGRNRVDALGSNGAGKSTLWDAFMWALTGRTVRGLRGIDVRTWGTTEQAMCRVDFYCDDRHHNVKRSTAKNGLWLDGKLVSQEEIDRLIGLSIVNIPHTILLGQKRDLFFDMRPQHKLELLSETLALDKWEVRSKRAKDAAHDYEAEQAMVFAKREHLQDLVNAMSEQLEETKAKSAEWSLTHGNAASARDRRIEGLKKSLEAAVTEKGTFDLAYDGAETELRAIRKDLIKKRSAMDEILEDISKARTKRDTRKARLDELRALAGSDTCPTCGQAVTRAHAHAAKARDALKEAKRLAAIASDRVIVHETRKELLRDVIVRMTKSETEFSEKSDNAKDKLDHLERHCADITQQIAVLKAESIEQENPHSEYIGKLRKAVRVHKQTIKDFDVEHERLERLVIRTRYWVKGFKQLRLYLLQETLEELEEVTQNLLPEFGLSGWSVQYDIERETKQGAVSTGLSVKILKPGMKKGVRWEAWSGGEGQRLLIVGAIALSEVLLRRAGIECDMMVLDESTRHVSREGIQEMVDFLITRARQSQIFFVDHTVVESNRFASVITITKDEHGAKIETSAT